jgi:hypothetical protein
MYFHVNHVPSQIWIKDPRRTVPEYLNDQKCENIIVWLLKFESISLAYSIIQGFDWPGCLYLSNIQDLSAEDL